MYLVTLGNMDMWVFLSHQDRFYQFLATSLVLSQKFVAEYEFYHHLIPKALFFFFRPEICKIPESERKGNFAQSFLFGF